MLFSSIELKQIGIFLDQMENIPTPGVFKEDRVENAQLCFIAHFCQNSPMEAQELQLCRNQCDNPQSACHFFFKQDLSSTKTTVPP
jgi:hypothetical protein